MSTITELIAKVVEGDALLDLLVQLYEAGFAHGSGTAVAQFSLQPLRRAELVELINLVRQRRWDICESAEAPVLTLEV